MAKVEFDNVQKKFGELTAVENNTLTIDDGELLVLVGPSGCGKTTTLRMIAGLEHPTSGAMYIGGNDVTGLSPGHRDIAMVFQDLALYPHKSVRENMEFGLEMRDYDRDEIHEQVQEAAEMLEIEEKLDQRPSDLSGGQQQRVALGRALVRDPEVFLLDEPLASLDAKLRATMRAEILELHNNIDATMVYVTHDQEIAMTLGDRIAVMNDGEIQQVADPETVYSKPANLFVARFVGSPDMNIFDAEVVENGESLHLTSEIFTFDLGHYPSETIEQLNDSGLKVGIRPQDIHDPKFLTASYDDNQTVSATTKIIEKMGSVHDIHFETEGVEFIGQINSDTSISRSDIVDVVFDTSKLHLFDAETGERIELKKPVGKVE